MFDSQFGPTRVGLDAVPEPPPVLARPAAFHAAPSVMSPVLGPSSNCLHAGMNARTTRGRECPYEPRARPDEPNSRARLPLVAETGSPDQSETAN